MSELSPPELPTFLTGRGTHIQLLSRHFYLPKKYLLFFESTFASSNPPEPNSSFFFFSLPLPRSYIFTFPSLLLRSFRCVPLSPTKAPVSLTVAPPPTFIENRTVFSLLPSLCVVVQKRCFLRLRSSFRKTFFSFVPPPRVVPFDYHLPQLFAC